MEIKAKGSKNASVSGTTLSAAERLNGEKGLSDIAYKQISAGVGVEAAEEEVDAEIGYEHAQKSEQQVNGELAGRPAPSQPPPV